MTPLRAGVPPLAAALAAAWGGTGLVALGALLGRAGCAVPTWPVHALAGVGCLAGLLGAPGLARGPDGAVRGQGLRAVLVAFAVAVAHAVVLFGLCLLMYVVFLGPLFAPAPGLVLPLGDVLWSALTAAGGGWTGLLAGALVAGRPAPARILAGAAGVGLVGFGLAFGGRAAAALVDAPFAGTVLLIAAAVAAGWLVMGAGGALALARAERRAYGLGLATLGGVWAGGAGLVALTWMVQALRTPLPPGVAGTLVWAPDPEVLAGALESACLLLPMPVLVAVVCGVAWVIARAPAPDAPADSL